MIIKKSNLLPYDIHRAINFKSHRKNVVGGHLITDMRTHKRRASIIYLNDLNSSSHPKIKAYQTEGKQHSQYQTMYNQLNSK